MPFDAADGAHPPRAGVKLREARERLGIDRAELSLRTKINERHLAAIEDSDFAALPARIYAVGFSRSYAGAVGLDAPAIAAEVRRELDEQDNPTIARPAYDRDLEDPAKVPSRTIAWIAAALGIALVVAGAVFWRTYFVPAVDLPPVREDVVASTTQAPELTPAAMISPTAESAAGIVTPDPAAVAPPPPAPAAAQPVSRAPAPRPSASASVPAVQAPPSPVPNRLEPVAEPAAAASAPAG